MWMPGRVRTVDAELWHPGDAISTEELEGGTCWGSNGDPTLAPLPGSRERRQNGFRCSLSRPSGGLTLVNRKNRAQSECTTATSAYPRTPILGSLPELCGLYRGC
jgi:hypothetical protein